MSSELLFGLRQWDDAAWRAVVEEYGPRIWAVARSHRLNEEDAADVFQATLLNLAEHIGHIKQPERISAWIVTTARRECLRVIRLRKPLPLKWRPEEEPEVPEDRVLEDARDQALWSAFKQLPSRCQQLLRLFA
ncbi:RNA polymerase sigma factor [Kibdelosporangium lantanae]|uniref:RNA polymerase sigma factor n=1 Tax=Kibdelosporangium lantanae TaxID=1497396 RepID=A0ABW3M818_9PSEU